MNEWDHIAWIRSQLAQRPDVVIGVGDDTALVQTDRQLLVTVDMLMEGIHFDLSQCSPVQVGRKAMNVNLSDIAAMAGTPKFAVVAVAIPKGRSPDFGKELFRGLQEAAQAFDVAVVGGDTNRSVSDVAVSVTVFGVPSPKGPLTRSGAKPGDAIFVTGTLGYSLQGKHLDFTPRVREAALLHQRYDLTSMMDLSDGLASDLFHIVEESRCGADLEASAIPIALSAATIVGDVNTPLEHALNDGEDFELLFTATPESARKIETENPLAPFQVPVTRIGTITDGPNVRLHIDGNWTELKPGGYQHQW